MAAAAATAARPAAEGAPGVGLVAGAGAAAGADWRLAGSTAPSSEANPSSTSSTERCAAACSLSTSGGSAAAGDRSAHVRSGAASAQLHMMPAPPGQLPAARVRDAVTRRRGCTGWQAGAHPPPRSLAPSPAPQLPPRAAPRPPLRRAGEGWGMCGPLYEPSRQPLAALQLLRSVAGRKQAPRQAPAKGRTRQQRGDRLGPARAAAGRLPRIRALARLIRLLLGTAAAPAPQLHVRVGGWAARARRPGRPHQGGKHLGGAQRGAVGAQGLRSRGARGGAEKWSGGRGWACRMWLRRTMRHPMQRRLRPPPRAHPQPALLPARRALAPTPAAPATPSPRASMPGSPAARAPPLPAAGPGGRR